LKTPESDEKGVPEKNKKPTFPVSGRVTVGGQPVAGATVALHRYDTETSKYTSVADGLTDDLGRFQITTYAKFDGAPAGDYVVTITRKEGIPAVFTTTETSTLKLRIHESPNTLSLDLPK